ncbi:MULTISPECIES: FKBP-type peptidyl-prolyl cis-trans isomerase [Gordonibacter]|uniref:Peptidyl-prolyl cis-trans isomerase n=1 Tax=Gordonibacter faecis TaxID=3047475 RepID=A0ABT7DMC9_9ACTN|nr:MULTISPECIES: FKBP-type peptidyl-prolyl cis-trans isomerase [unclassified Gordonibacter]MDJ1649728.1 FKBP-type peptidyl-prolyl cis-trans isomerase [Gordonibacter sp. KGMB12511]HIW76532.1 FKBP-type peptidyl-prolyl cis-trans isomerase [Candidatus Gordonibacter avicola]
MNKPGDKVRIAYRGTCAQDAAFYDVRETGNPLEVILGNGSVFPPIEQALFDMTPGETRRVEVPARYGFGEVDSEAVRSFPLIAMPRWQDVEQGTFIEVQSDRSALPATAYVRSIEHDVLVLDFNHPHAGKDLSYEVTLLAVNERSALEAQRVDGKRVRG